MNEKTLSGSAFTRLRPHARGSASSTPVFLLLALVACTRPQPRSGPDAGAAEALNTLPRPRRGGEVARTSFGTAELVHSRGELSLYLDPPSLEGVTAKAKLAFSALPELEFKPEGDRLLGRHESLPAELPTAVVVLTRAGAMELVRFAASPVTHVHTSAARTPREPGLDELTVFVTDSTCLLRGEADHDHRECAVRCINGGAAIALVERGTEKVYVATAAPGQSVKDLLLPHVGSSLLVRGIRRPQGGSQFLEVREVYPSHDHASLFGGAVGMAGDLHLEVLALRSGEVRIYLSDDFRKPIEAGGTSGEVEVRVGKGDLQRAEAKPSADQRYLSARVSPLPAQAAEVTARLKLGELLQRFSVPGDPSGEFFMTFVVDPQGEGGEPPTRAATAQARPGEVRIEVSNGYAPAEVRVKKGVTTRLRFFRKNDSECTRELLIPSLGIKTELKALAETVVEVKPEASGAYPFTCGMKMLKGTLVVED
jgi:hypothetical protein